MSTGRLTFRPDAPRRRTARADSLLPFLAEEVEVADLTLAGLLARVARERRAFERVFSSALGGLRLAPFLAEAALAPRRRLRAEGDAIEVFWLVTRDGDRVEIAPQCHGLARDEGGDGVAGHDLSFLPLHELAGRRVVLDEALEVPAPDGRRILIRLRQRFRVFDVLLAVLSEITFHGYPRDRERRLARMAG